MDETEVTAAVQCATKCKRCKRGRVTRNPFLNFLREFRRKYCGMPSSQVVRLAAKAWRCMSDREKEKYRCMACKAKPFRCMKNRRQCSKMRGCCKRKSRSSCSQSRSRCPRKRKRSCSKKRRRKSRCARRRRKSHCPRRRRKSRCPRRRRKSRCAKKRRPTKMPDYCCN